MGTGGIGNRGSVTYGRKAFSNINLVAVLRVLTASWMNRADSDSYIENGLVILQG